jgi:small subunit ribosomal protein S17
MTEATEPKKSGLRMTGIVSSNKMTNTVIVKVVQVKVHPKYQKRYRVTNKFVADTAGNAYAIGDKVEILETKPMSKTKRWIVTRKV